MRRNQGLQTVQGGGRCKNGNNCCSFEETKECKEIKGCEEINSAGAWHVGGCLGSEMRNGLPGSGMRDGLWEQSAIP